jgi:hypothetical protein
VDAFWSATTYNADDKMLVDDPIRSLQGRIGNAGAEEHDQPVMARSGARPRIEAIS